MASKRKQKSKRIKRQPSNLDKKPHLDGRRTEITPEDVKGYIRYLKNVKASPSISSVLECNKTSISGSARNLSRLYKACSGSDWKKYCSTKRHKNYIKRIRSKRDIALDNKKQDIKNEIRKLQKSVKTAQDLHLKYMEYIESELSEYKKSNEYNLLKNISLTVGVRTAVYILAEPSLGEIFKKMSDQNTSSTKIAELISHLRMILEIGSESNVRELKKLFSH